MFHFPGRRDDEQVLMVIRKHVMVYVKLVAIFSFCVLLPLGLFLAFWFRYHPYGLESHATVTAMLFSSLYFLYGLAFLCMAWLNEAFDLFVITSERLVDITQGHLFKRTVSATPLEQIQDTTGITEGILATLFSYGDVIVKTAAGKESDFFMDHVWHPAHVARDVLNWANEKRQKGKAVSPSSS